MPRGRDRRRHGGSACRPRGWERAEQSVMRTSTMAPRGSGSRAERRKSHLKRYAAQTTACDGGTAAPGACRIWPSTIGTSDQSCHAQIAYFCADLVLARFPGRDFLRRRQTIELLKAYPADPGTRAMADSAVRALWGARGGLPRDPWFLASLAALIQQDRVRLRDGLVREPG